MLLTSEQTAVAEQLRFKIANAVGVTLVDDCLTIRWRDPNGCLLSVSLIMIEVVTPSDVKAMAERTKRYNMICKRDKDFVENTFYVEEGEWSQ